MAIYLNEVDNLTLVKTICFPLKTMRLEKGTFLYIPTRNKEKLKTILNNLKTKATIKFRNPKLMYQPMTIRTKLGTKQIIYRKNDVAKDIRSWKADGFTNAVYDKDYIRDFNGSMDYTAVYDEYLDKYNPVRNTAHTLWDIVLPDLNLPHSAKYIVWTPDNILANVVSIGGIPTTDWKSKDFYSLFLWFLRYEPNKMIDRLRSLGVKVIWTDYRYSLIMDPMSSDYDGDKLIGMKILVPLFKELKKMRMGVVIDVEDDESIESIEELNLGEIKETNDDPLLETITEVITPTVKSTTQEDVDNSELIDKLNKLVEVNKSKDIDYDKKINDVMAIIERSKVVNDYVPKRLEVVTKRQNEITNKSIHQVLSSVEEETRNIIEVKEHDGPGVFNKFSLQSMDKQYNEKQGKIDRINCLAALSKSDAPVFLSNYKEEDDLDTPDAKQKKVQVTFASPEDHEVKHTFTFNMPTLRDDKFLFLGGSDKVMNRQKVTLPIVRLRDRVAFTTYYNKMFIVPTGGNISRRIARIKKFVKAVRSKYTNKDVSWISFIPTVGVASNNNYYNEELYDVTRILSRIEIDEANYMDLSATSNVVGLIGGFEYYANTQDDYIYNKDKSVKLDILQFIGYFLELGQHKSKGNEIWEIWQNAIKGRGTDNIMYSVSTANYSKKPLLYIILHALNYNLHTLLERLKDEYDLKYEIIPFDDKFRNRSKDYDDMDEFLFKNFALRITYNSTANRTLLSRLLVHDFSELDSLNLETVLEDEFTATDTLNLNNLRDLFIDPITKDVMDNIGVPSDYVGALIYANALLFNYDRPISETSLKYERMPANSEIINGMMYKVLAQAYGEYVKKIKAGTNPAKVKFAIPADAVIRKLQESPSVSESSKLNPVSHVSNQMLISNKGIEGMGLNEERAYTIQKRLWDDSFYGIISDVSPYSGTTGTNRQLAVNPNITDIRGFFNPKPNDVAEIGPDGTMSVSEGLGTFAQKHDSSPRTAMGMSQFNHLMPTIGSEPALVTYGLDETISHLDSDFVFRAKGPGRILAMTNTHIKIKYDNPDLGTEVYNTKAIVRNSEKAFYIPNDMKVNRNLKVGGKVTEDTIIAFNTMCYSELEEGTPIFKSGPIAYVAIAHTQNSYEDSAVISESLAKRLASKTIKRIAVRLKHTDRVGIFNTNIGSTVNAGDILMRYLPSNGSPLTGIFGDTEELSDVLSTTVTAHYQGILRDIYIHTKLGANDHLDKSIKKLKNNIKDYYEYKEKTNKLKTNNNSDDIRTIEHVVDYPVSKKVKINKDILDKGDVLIEFFVEVDQAFSIADKITFGNTALKGVCSTVRKDNERPSGVETGRVVDAIISPISPMARMVYSMFMNGYLSEAVKKANEDILDMLHIK